MRTWRSVALLTGRFLQRNEACGACPAQDLWRGFASNAESGTAGSKGLEPGFFFLQPKDHLVDRYYSVENLSSAERHKLDLKKVREQFRIHEGDCGSSQVQVAVLTEKIKFLSKHMSSHKKDVHSRRGLEAMVQQRRSLLKYFRRKDWDAYCALISTLGLRDRTESN